MGKKYCEVLDPNRIWRIAFNACYSLRSGKAADAEPECSAYASEVVKRVCDLEVGNLDSTTIEDSCCKHVLDPWGTDIGLGWIGNLLCPDCMCSPDCHRIASNTFAAIEAAVEGVNEAENFGSSGGTPLGGNLLGGGNEEYIDAMVKLQMFSVIRNMLSTNTNRYNFVYAMIKPMTQFMQVFLMFFMIQAVSNML